MQNQQLQQLAKSLIYYCYIDEWSDAYKDNLNDRFRALYAHTQHLLQQGVRSYDIFQNREKITEMAKEIFYSKEYAERKNFHIAQTWQVCKIMKYIKNHKPMTYNDIY